MSVAEILNSAKGLESNNFEELFRELSVLRVQRNGIFVLDEVETKLLSKINSQFDTKKWERLKYLDWKLEFDSLTEKEASESLKLAESYENYSVERLKNLSQLAQLRKISIDKLLEQLGENQQIYA
jgi:DNA-binding PucR family transcriptional regulator